MSSPWVFPHHLCLALVEVAPGGLVPHRVQPVAKVSKGLWLQGQLLRQQNSGAGTGTSLLCTEGVGLLDIAARAGLAHSPLVPPLLEVS